MHRVNGSKIGHITWSLVKLKSLQASATSNSSNNTKLNSSLTQLNRHLTYDDHQTSSLNKSASNTLNCSDRDKSLQSGSINQGDSLEFRYYSGLNVLLAQSVPLKVVMSSGHNENSSVGNSSSSSSSSASSFESVSTPPPPPTVSNSVQSNKRAPENEFVTFKISDIKASQLRKGMFFNPDPYVKITVIPSAVAASSSSARNLRSNSAMSHHYQYGYAREYKTFIATNTCFPTWKNDNFIIVARENDRILFEVKDKFARTKPSINRFLGRVLLDINNLIERTKHTKG